MSSTTVLQQLHRHDDAKDPEPLTHTYKFSESDFLIGTQS